MPYFLYPNIFANIGEVVLRPEDNVYDGEYYVYNGNVIKSPITGSVRDLILRMQRETRIPFDSITTCNLQGRLDAINKEPEPEKGKYVIIDIINKDFVKDKHGKVCLYESEIEADLACGMYKLENVWITKLIHKHI